MKYHKVLFAILFTLFITACSNVGRNTEKAMNGEGYITICNPVNINYRYRPKTPSRREAGDPVIVLYKDDYYLFASVSGGYWWSRDLSNWTFVKTDEIQDSYAPTVKAINDTLYFITSDHKGFNTIFKSINPKKGKWTKAGNLDLDFRVWDPTLFLDDDNRLYLYYGCSGNTEPIYGVELDVNDKFKTIGKPVEFFWGYPKKNGWEQNGENNDDTIKKPWIEGPEMIKHNGRYYLQYAAPGTQLTSYADGVYVSDKPLGPYKYAKHNPFSYKPGGFIRSAGHSNTFEDRYGNFWHIATQVIAINHKFERRLGLFPAFFDSDDIMVTSTRFGDYPMVIPDKKVDKPEDIFPGWMLLSYNMPVETSSVLDSLYATNLVDENIKTFWAAKTGNKGEWAMLDLEEACRVNAIQLNYFDYKTGVSNRDSSVVYIQYLLEASNDKEHWTILEDKCNNTSDVPHDYIQLKEPEKFRYIKLTNHHIPGGNFALSGIRVFGKGNGEAPAKVEGVKVIRNEHDRRMVTLTWEEVGNTTGYNILFGIAEDKLYNTVQVSKTNSRVLRSLNVDQSYYFAIEAFNENGVSERSNIQK